MSMRITVSKNELAPAFSWAASGLPARPAAPVLGGMRLTVRSRTLTMTVFDYERATRGWLPGSGARAGEILVDGRNLQKVIRSLPKGSSVQVTFQATREALTVSAGDITWTLPALPDGEYPALPEMPPATGTVDGEAFAASVARVAAAAGRDDTLPVLTGVLLDPGTEALTLVATDRYRIAVDRLPWTPPAGAGGWPRPVVPARHLSAFAAKTGAGKVTVHLGEEFTGFRDDSHEMIIHPFAGDFPRCSAMFRDESPVVLTADAQALAAAVRRIGAMAEKNTPVILHYARGHVTVQARDGEVTASEPVPAGAEGSGGFEVAFNPAFLASMLNGFSGYAHIGLREPTARGHVAMLTGDPETFRVGLMTIRLSEEA